MCGSRVRPGSRARNAFLLGSVRGLDCAMAKPLAHRLRRRPGWFRPVPLRPRRDGWSVARQCAFLVQLYLTGSVAVAARHVGMSRASAYRLRARAGAHSFANACDRVLTPPGSGSVMGAREDFRKVTDPELLARVKRGLVRPMVYRGAMVGIARKPDIPALLRLTRRVGSSDRDRLSARSRKGGASLPSGPSECVTPTRSSPLCEAKWGGGPRHRRCRGGGAMVPAPLRQPPDGVCDLPICSFAENGEDQQVLDVAKAVALTETPASPRRLPDAVLAPDPARVPFGGAKAVARRETPASPADYRMRCSPRIQRESLLGVRRPLRAGKRQRLPADYRMRCSPRIQRTVPLDARITTLSVVMRPPLRRFTPSSSDPEVTPVAAKMQSPLARSSSL